MSELQVVTLLATLIGLIATVLNLVAFVREKDKSHTRAGLGFLLLLVLLLAVVFLPRYAPETAREIVSAMPTSVAGVLQPWLNAPPAPIAVPEAAPPFLGSFTIEIQRNLLGGIGALVSNFQFSNSSAQSVRVTAYSVRITGKLGEAARSYDRVLAEPVVVGAGGTATTQVELDAEIRDQWVAREDLDAAERGPIEITWQCQDGDGRHFRLSSQNG
jgi:hypothetical protein